MTERTYEKGEEGGVSDGLEAANVGIRDYRAEERSQIGET